MCTLFLMNASARASIVFDDFETSAGHFGFTPTFSSTSNVAASSTAARITTDSSEGSASMQLNLVMSVTSPARVRWVSGGPPYNSSTGGVPASNTSFTTTAGTDGFIGFYAKASSTGGGAKLQLNIDASDNVASNDVGTRPIAIIGDNQWHVYEWNLDAASDFASVTGITSNTVLTNASHTIDSIYIGGETAGMTLGVDFVALNDAGSIALLPEPTSLGLLGLMACGYLSRRRRARTQLLSQVCGDESQHRRVARTG